MVLVKLDDKNSGTRIEEKLAQANLLVQSETLMTSDNKISYPVLRLSSLDPTTRALTGNDMFTVGLTLGEFLKSAQDSQAIKSVEKIIRELVEDLPLFAEDWLPEAEIIREGDAELMMKAMIYGM